MRILIACDPEANDIIPLEKDALMQSGIVQQVFCGHEYFWQPPSAVDIVHIHWPEALFSWHEPDEEGLDRLDRSLRLWQETAKIVVTSHNQFPHYRDTQMFQRLYQLVYRHADAVIHMGSASREDFIKRYPELGDIVHAMIPHGMYPDFANSTTREEARRRFGFREEDLVFLAFGNIRDVEELRLLIDAFDAAKLAKKRLLVAGKFNVARRSLKGMLYRCKLSFARGIKSVPEFIPRDDVQYYFNASDIVVIPRINILNSGNVALGFSFGRCIIGPDTGVVGEILAETGNLPYRAGDSRSFAAAMEAASRMDLPRIGLRNREYALRNWNWDVIAGKHLALFQRLLQP